ncbi:hypothetical protein [Sphingobium sp. B2]|uniref:hypothetical protein n=1 Tax=Sphingobium sp. B2 TaxID=2583228 RepID=UPI001643DD2D|nr:hypothetical protein [Sphingobium sp. B2]
MFRAIKNEITTLRYHRAHAAMAASILSNIEGQKGRTSPGIITRSTDALDVSADGRWR